MAIITSPIRNSLGKGAKCRVLSGPLPVVGNGHFLGHFGNLLVDFWNSACRVAAILGLFPSSETDRFIPGVMLSSHLFLLKSAQTLDRVTLCILLIPFMLHTTARFYFSFLRSRALLP